MKVWAVCGAAIRQGAQHGGNDALGGRDCRGEGKMYWVQGLGFRVHERGVRVLGSTAFEFRE